MASLKYKKILVTGGTGLVGSHLTEELLLQKAEVIVVSRSFDPRSYFFSKGLHQQVIQVPADLKNSSRITDIVTKHRPDYIVHLAAQPLVDVAYINPLETLETNIMGTAHLLEATRKLPSITGIIVASSDKAYGKMENTHYRETDPLQGDHPYEVSKSATDLIGQMYHRTYGLPVVVTRFGNIYGPGDLNFTRLIPKLCRALILKRMVKLRSDGTFIRDYLYVKDVVSGYLRILKQINTHVGECFNFGSTENLSVLQVIHLVEQLTGKKIRYKILNTQQNEIPKQSLQYSKAQKLLHWKPKYTFAEAFKTTFEWYRRYLSS